MPRGRKRKNVPFIPPPWIPNSDDDGGDVDQAHGVPRQGQGIVPDNHVRKYWTVLITFNFILNPFFVFFY